MNDDLLRTFVAVRPTQERRTQIAETVRRTTESDPDLKRRVRPVRPGRLHLTLAFLGALPVGRETELLAAVQGAATAHDRFEIGFEGLGGFPTAERARVAWLGVREGRGQTIALATTLRARLEEAGLPFDAKPFRPHLTVARSRRAPVRLPTSADVRIPPCPVAEVEVVRSVFGPEGTEHRTLARWPLARPDAG